MQQLNEVKIDIPHEYLCPILQRIMNDPVLVGEQTFERLAIEEWYKKTKLAP
jgi:hypothetical protein